MPGWKWTHLAARKLISARSLRYAIAARSDTSLPFTPSWVLRACFFVDLVEINLKSLALSYGPRSLNATGDSDWALWEEEKLEHVKP